MSKAADEAEDELEDAEKEAARLIAEAHEMVTKARAKAVVSTSKSSTSGLLALGYCEHQASKQAKWSCSSKQAHEFSSRLAMLDTFSLVGDY